MAKGVLSGLAAVDAVLLDCAIRIQTIRPDMLQAKSHVFFFFRS